MVENDPQKDLPINSIEENTSTKDNLECKKLRLEIAELERMWWKKPAYIFASLPIILAFGSLGIGFLTGYFQAATTKLENQKFTLEQQIREFESKRDQLHQENERLAKERDTFKSQLNKINEEIQVALEEMQRNSSAVTTIYDKNKSQGKKKHK